MKHQIYDITYTRHDGSEWTRTEGGETADERLACDKHRDEKLADDNWDELSYDID